MTAVLLWKEYRQQRTFWLVMIGLALLLVVSIAETLGRGRGMEAFDKCTIDKIAESLARNNYRFSALVIDIVKSDPFEMRRGRTVSRKPDDKPLVKGDPKVQPKGNK